MKKIKRNYIRYFVVENKSKVILRNTDPYYLIIWEWYFLVFHDGGPWASFRKELKVKEKESVPEIAQNRQNGQTLINIHCTLEVPVHMCPLKKLFSKILLNSQPIRLVPIQQKLKFQFPIRHHPFRMYVKFSEEITFVTP